MAKFKFSNDGKIYGGAAGTTEVITTETLFDITDPETQVKIQDLIKEVVGTGTANINSRIDTLSN
jgi:hypothetical protein